MAGAAPSELTTINLYCHLLYRQECFAGKCTTHKIHTKLHPGPKWRIFQTLTSEDIDDVISRLCRDVCANSQWKMASDRFVKFSEADVKSFSEKQENANMKN